MSNIDPDRPRKRTYIPPAMFQSSEWASELHLTPKKIKNSFLLFPFSGLPRYMGEIPPMPKEDNRRCIVCHEERSLLNSPMRAVCVHEVTHVRDRIDGHRRRQQKRRGTRPESRYGGAAAETSRGGGPGCGNPSRGVSGYRRRRRKGKTANLRRNSRFKESRQRFL